MRSLKEKLWKFVVAAVAITLALSVFADLDDLSRALRTFEWRLLPIVFGLTLANQFFRFLKWEYLLRVVDVRVPLSTSVQVFGSGLIMILTPGKLGEVWKSWLLRDVEGVPVRRTIPVVGAERITDLFGVATIGAVGVVAFDQSPYVLALVLLPVVAGILLLQYERACFWLLDLSRSVPIVCGRTDQLRDFYGSSKGVLRLKPLILTTVLSVISWGMECVGLWLVLRGLDAHVDVLAAAFVFSVASVLGALSFLPGGIGVTESSMTGLLLLFGVSRAAAVSSTIIIRAATLWFVAALALVVYLLFQKRQSLVTADANS